LGGAGPLSLRLNTTFFAIALDLVTSTMAVKPNPLVPYYHLLVVVVSVFVQLSVITTSHAFVVHRANYHYSAPPISITRRDMSVDKPEIVVVSKPDEDFLAKKG
jgi:hypothetical protein